MFSLIHLCRYSYVTKELPNLLKNVQGLDTTNVSIMGHSMGGHGALTIGIKNPLVYKSISGEFSLIREFRLSKVTLQYIIA